MAAQYKGYAVVYGDAGTITVAGAAYVNSHTKANIKDASEIQAFKDSLGATRTLIKPEDIKEISVSIRPGSGESKTPAQVKALAGVGSVVNKGDTFIMASDCNALDAADAVKAIVWDYDFGVDSEGAAMLNIVARYYNAGGVTDFTAAWASV